ncbi:Fc.00g049900.m01.CDS01 [Cosmosporella sp. VM-42]
MAEPATISGEVEHRYQRQPSEEATDLTASITSSIQLRSPPKDGFRERLGLAFIGRRTLGIIFLLVTVFLWTLSNFLASSLFSDNTYDKPFFVVYVNSTFFGISLIPRSIAYLRRHGIKGLRQDAVQLWNEQRHGGAKIKTLREEEEQVVAERLLADIDDGIESVVQEEEKLGFRETAILSLEFSMLWFLANYFASACFEYTSVASGTILTSTSSVWTLVLCAICHIEPFSMRKLLGVLASVAGVILISTVDLTGKNDEGRGSFPHKTPTEIAIGDAMAFLSAMIYGVYVTVMKRRVGDENRVDMQLFFGLVGLFNLAMLWPVFFILHFTGLETFEMPPSGWVWTIILTNSLSSFVSDIAWAWAMLLTTPLVVTVGLSLTIPLSLIGEMLRFGQYSSFMYWMGAAVVFISFLFINHESHDLAEERNEAAGEAARDDTV